MIFVVIIFLALCGCESIRDIEVCKLKWNKDKPEKSYADCATGEKKYKKTMAELDDAYAMPKSEVSKIAEKLTACEEAKE